MHTNTLTHTHLSTHAHMDTRSLSLTHYTHTHTNTHTLTHTHSYTYKLHTVTCTLTHSLTRYTPSHSYYWVCSCHHTHHHGLLDTKLCPLSNSWLHWDAALGQSTGRGFRVTWHGWYSISFRGDVQEFNECVMCDCVCAYVRHKTVIFCQISLMLY